MILSVRILFFVFIGAFERGEIGFVRFLLVSFFLSRGINRGWNILFRLDDGENGCFIRVLSELLFVFIN